jgi:lipopolysaccharide/colanic/teichoic acid biosynthesis glycosyltransferase
MNITKQRIGKDISTYSSFSSIFSSIDTDPFVEGKYLFYGKSQFHHMLCIERKRTERSKKPFLLLLLDISSLMKKESHKEILEKIKSILYTSLREIDIRGWFDDNKTIGVICPKMVFINANPVEGIIRKIYDQFCERLDPELIKKLNFSSHIYPETYGDVSINGPFNITLYPDLTKRNLDRELSMTVKNFVDIMGSAIALLLFSPLFLIIAVSIKATSAGSVFFKQERVGLNGKTFSLLKFRSMYANADNKKHKEYIKKYIGEQNNAAVEPGVFKLTNDSRITTVGCFLRKTSLDELPQLINVFKGDMSLVGPRPPIPYECDLYDIWHKRRLLSCKPGITGLWQVMGRSRTTFDEMVRIDLKYISEWNLWLDFKILLKTPKAVLNGDGAY